MTARLRNRAEERGNALLSAFLLAGIAVAGNAVARRHLTLRADFSDDQLYAISDATRSIVGGLEERMQVKAFFTGDIQSGEVALAKARLEALLAEYEVLAGGLLRVDYVDPSRSSEALIDAENYGVQARPIVSFQGTNRVEQNVYLGLLVRYRGREDVIPFVEPWSLETQLSSRIYGLMRERRRVVGWFGSEPDEESEATTTGTFGHAKGLLARHYEVREVEHLKLGEPVSEDVEVLFVVRPVNLHPRAVFEIDQFVQRGGRLVMLVDQVAMSWRQWTGTERPTGVDDLLSAWGARVTPQHVWDDPWKGTLLVPLRQRDPVDPTQSRLALVPHEYPLFVQIRRAGLDARVPPTAQLQAALFPWAQPIAPRPEPPEGVERTDWIRSSEEAYRVEMATSVVHDRSEVQARTDALYALGGGRAYALAVVLAGRFPSPFEGGAPARWDPVSDAPGTDSGVEVLSRGAETQVVVFGDADWLRDSNRLFPFFVRENQLLLQNLVDWLLLDEALVALRSRVPRDRGIRDFVDEEKRRLGVLGTVEADTQAELDLEMRREAEAARAARARQWQRMLLPVGATLALLLGFGALWNLLERRPRGTHRAVQPERSA